MSGNEIDPPDGLGTPDHAALPPRPGTLLEPRERQLLLSIAKSDAPVELSGAELAEIIRALDRTLTALYVFSKSALANSRGDSDDAAKFLDHYRVTMQEAATQIERVIQVFAPKDDGNERT